MRQRADLAQASSDAAAMASRLQAVEAEKARLENLNKRLNAAFEALQTAQSEARKEHEQRENLIKNSQSSKNWRSDPLPADLARLLCDAANTLCDDGAADGAVDALRGADGDDVSNE